MVTFEDVQSDDSSNHSSSYDSDDSRASSASVSWGLTLEEKQKFLLDIDKFGGFSNVERVWDSDQPFYGDPSTEEGKKRKRQFRNLLYGWKKKKDFASLRASLLYKTVGLTSPNHRRRHQPLTTSPSQSHFESVGASLSTLGLTSPNRHRRRRPSQSYQTPNSTPSSRPATRSRPAPQQNKTMDTNDTYDMSDDDAGKCFCAGVPSLFLTSCLTLPLHCYPSRTGSLPDQRVSAMDESHVYCGCLLQRPEGRDPSDGRHQGLPPDP